MRARLLVFFVLLTALLVGRANALNIVVSNDDGFESANTRALYERLVAAGHDVIVAAPTQNNSGKGGSIDFLRPITPLTRATRWATVPAGAPGVGVDPQVPTNIFYVDGTPVMSLLYGLDVQAVKRWAGPPDLVISGPNEGNNTGAVNVSSGTVANAQYGINRGIPSIAVSYAGTTGKSYTTLNSGSVEYAVADVVVQLVAVLERNARSHQPLLPYRSGLNVNIPTLTPGAPTPRFALTRIGTATGFGPVFYERLSDSPLAVASGVNLPLPGISLVSAGQTPPSGVQIPADSNPSSEANALGTGRITISVLGGVPEAPLLNELLVGYKLRELLKSKD